MFVIFLYQQDLKILIEGFTLQEMILIEPVEWIDGYCFHYIYKPNELNTIRFKTRGEEHTIFFQLMIKIQ